MGRLDVVQSGRLVRGVHARLRNLTLLSIALLCVGCSSNASDVDSNVKAGSGQVMNPTGKPQTPEEAAYAAKMQQTGNAMNAEMQKEAAARAAAMSKAGK